MPLVSGLGNGWESGGQHGDQLRSLRFLGNLYFNYHFGFKKYFRNMISSCTPRVPLNSQLNENKTYYDEMRISSVYRTKKAAGCEHSVSFESAHWKSSSLFRKQGGTLLQKAI
jgi:hypothetical protein